MATPVYSVPFFNADISLGVPATFTVPAGATAVLRDIDLFINQVVLEGGLANVTAGLWALLPFTWPPGFSGVLSWRGRLVVPGPSSLTATVLLPDGSDIRLYAGGYLLSP